MENNEKNVPVQPATNSVKSAKQSAKTSSVKKERKPRKSIKQSVKEIISELKKVSWPTFPTVVKQTMVVITVVLVFALVLLGFDSLFSLLYDLLVKTVA